ncbi:MAG: YicC family protein [Deltaproteobacteria bacterium]|nr:MAG: YicC family protein [Deltaproteobacteria bacterium]
MLKSMTAYGRAESSQGTMEFIAELRSGNSRYREIIPRIPQSLQQFEDRIRSIISSRLKRGRIEISIQIKDNDDKGLSLELNRPLIKAYINIFNELNKELGCKQPIDLSFFSQLKDAIIIKQDSVDLEEIWPDLKDVIDSAALALDTMRINEGKALERDFLERLNNIARYIDEIRDRANVIVEDYLDKLTRRIQKLIEDVEINEDRLVQEVAFMAERSDITEELIRIESHLEQFRNYMNQDDVIGRRLDFLLQEINREVNTIGSKAGDSLISQRAVEIKAELEKLREQIQNVE